MVKKNAVILKKEFPLKKYTEMHSPGYVIEVYKDDNQEEIVFGNRESIPKRKKCNKDTLYDIASLTKVYTAVLIYKAQEEGKLNLYDTIFKIDSRFVSLKHTSVLDLLSHNQEIWTHGYLGDAKSKNEFYKILFSAEVKSNIPTYVDTHYIILSTLLEKIYNKPLEEILKEKILNSLNLTKTTTDPTSKNIASNNYEHKNGTIIDTLKLGLIHDTKARVAKGFGITTGHASIFTTGEELLEFLKTFLNQTLLKKETIQLMLQHQDRNLENYQILKGIVKEQEINQMYQEAVQQNPKIKLLKTYNNMGVRYKNHIKELNDVPKNCSENTVVFSGFTGPAFLIDFNQKIIIIVMCNVIHNTKLNRIQRKKLTDEIIEEIYNETIKERR